MRNRAGPAANDTQEDFEEESANSSANDSDPEEGSDWSGWIRAERERRINRIEEIRVRVAQERQRIEQVRDRAMQVFGTQPESTLPTNQEEPPRPADSAAGPPG